MSDGPTTVTSGLDLDRPLVVGFGVTGRAVVRALVVRGHQPTVAEDRAGEDHRSAAAELGVQLEEGLDEAGLAALVRQATVVLPSPGIPDRHPVFAAASAAGVPVASEFDLAQRWDDRTVVAITGTNGKTSVTMMVADALNRSGVVAEAVGNTEVPYVEAIDRPEIEVFVVEASSFRLGHSHAFRPDVAAWINLAPDHLDAHATLDDYVAAKAKIWSDLPDGAIMVANAEDPVVIDNLPAGANPGPKATVRAQTFAIAAGSNADWRIDSVDGVATLVGPDGPLLPVDRLSRRQPHDQANALATAAIAAAAGAGIDGIIATLTTFEGLPHRLEYLGSWGEVAWYNDSKATVPHATVAAVGGFESVVLIAGGYDKGLPFEPLRSTVPPVRSVVAIGDAAPKIDSVLGDLVPVTRATSMRDAIVSARTMAEAGDAVLLSPACASFDWYPNYVQRGLDFTALVTEEVAAR